MNEKHYGIRNKNCKGREIGALSIPPKYKKPPELITGYNCDGLVKSPRMAKMSW